MKAQTKALLASVVVIALALSAVSGITYSWWSDSEQTEITVNTGYVDVTTSEFSITKGGVLITGTPDSIPSTMGITFQDSEESTAWDSSSNSLMIRDDTDEVITITYTATFSWSVASKYNMDFETTSVLLDDVTDMTIDSGAILRGEWTHVTGTGTQSYNAVIEIGGLPSHLSDVRMSIKNHITQEKSDVGQWNGRTTEPISPSSGGQYMIYNASQLAWVAKQVNGGEMTFKDSTVKLMENIDLGGYEWAPIGNAYNTSVSPHNLRTFQGIFDGNGKTITGLNVNVGSGEDNNYAAGLFGWFGSPDANAKVEDLVISGARISGHHDVGGIVGYLYVGAIFDCTVRDSVITNTWEDAEKGGDKTGGIVGYMNGNVSVCGNTVKNVSITGCRDLGAISGILWSSDTFKNNSVLGTTSLEYSAIGSPDSHTNGNLGQIVGRLEGATVDPTNTVEGTMVASTTESLNSLIESGATQITLSGNLNNVPASLKSLGSTTERATLTIDMGGHTIYDDGDVCVYLENAELVLKNGRIEGSSGSGVINVGAASQFNKLVLDEMTIVGGPFGVVVTKGDYDIEIKNSTIVAQKRCITTFAEKQGGSNINIQGSVLKTTETDSSSLDFIPGDEGATLTVSDSTIESKGRCAVIRNGNATFVNTKFVYSADQHDAAYDQNWGAAIKTSFGALVIGGLQNSNRNYYGDVEVKLISCHLQFSEGANNPWGVVVGQDKNSETTVLTLDDSSEFSKVQIIAGEEGHLNQNVVSSCNLPDDSITTFSWGGTCVCYSSTSL